MTRAKGLVFIGLAAVALLLAGCTEKGSIFDIDSSPISVGVQYNDIAIAAWGTNFYRFTAAASATHTIWLTGLSSDMSWDLFTNPNYLNPNIIDSQDENFNSADEVGSTPMLSGGMIYYIAVEEWDDLAGTFDLRVTCP
jgi:hypothetical protein